VRPARIGLASAHCPRRSARSRPDPAGSAPVATRVPSTGAAPGGVLALPTAPGAPAGVSTVHRRETPGARCPDPLDPHART